MDTFQIKPQMERFLSLFFAIKISLEKNWFKKFLSKRPYLSNGYLKVGKFQNEFMKSSFLQKYEPKIVRISDTTGQRSFHIFWEMMTSPDLVSYLNHLKEFSPIFCLINKKIIVRFFAKKVSKFSYVGQ